MKDRIKEVRTSNGLSMEKFGERLKISKSAVYYLETGKNTPSPQTISLICREYHINEEWLRTGEGQMHTENALTEQLFEWAGRTLQDEDSFKVDFLKMLMQLDPEDWQLIERMAKKLLKAQQERENGGMNEAEDSGETDA